MSDFVVTQGLPRHSSKCDLKRARFDPFGNLPANKNRLHDRCHEFNLHVGGEEWEGLWHLDGDQDANLRVFVAAASSRDPIVRAGTPPTIENGVTSLVTTDPAPTMHPRPNVTP